MPGCRWVSTRPPLPMTTRSLPLKPNDETRRLALESIHILQTLKLPLPYLTTSFCAMTMVISFLDHVQ